MPSEEISSSKRTASSRSSSVTSTSVPPVVQVENISWKCTSKLKGANCNVRVPGPAIDALRCQAIRFDSAARPRATPLGFPVDPEV